MDQAVNAANLGAAAGDLSMWALFMHASIVVKLVMIGLVTCSVIVWAIIFDKFTTVRRVNRLANDFEERFWAGGSWKICTNRMGRSLCTLCCGIWRGHG